MSNWDYAGRIVMMFAIGFMAGKNWDAFVIFAESIK